MIFDTHAHCYWDTLESRIEDIVSSMQSVGVTKAVQIGCDRESSQKAISLALRFPGVFYATIGVHPETAQDLSEYDGINGYENLIIDYRDCIVGIGETGLDFHYLDGTDSGKNPIDFTNLSIRAKEQIENQKNWWSIQHKLAIKYDLPLIIHTRDARDETLKFMKDEGVKRAVMHCFSEDWDFARVLLDFSDEIYFSFSGIVTYKNAVKIQEAAKNIPLNRILVETDAPFLAPQPVRGSLNEPKNTRYVLQKLCELRSESSEEIERIVYENSVRFYSIT